MIGRIARREAVLALLEMRLEDEIDHVHVIQRVDDVLKHAAPRLRRFAFGQRGDGIEACEVHATDASVVRPHPQEGEPRVSRDDKRAALSQRASAPSEKAEAHESGAYERLALSKFHVGLLSWGSSVLRCKCI